MVPIKQTPTREIYQHEENQIIVFKDTLSLAGKTFPDVQIPYWGCVTAQLTRLWWHQILMQSLAVHPFISADTLKMPEMFRDHGYLGQSLLVHTFQEVSVEFHVDKYVTESLLGEYQETGSLFGSKYNNLTLHQDLVVPVIRITEKNSHGEDVEIGLEALGQKLENPSFAEAMLITASYIYMNNELSAKRKGIVFANLKVQFGFDPDGYLAVMNEVFTPSTCDIWYIDKETGEVKDAFSINAWIKDNIREDGTLPTVPEELIQKTSKEYFEFYERLTGKKCVP